MLAALGLGHRLAGHGDRVPDAVPGLRGVDRHARALTQNLQLLDRVGPLEVGRDQHRRVALLAQPEGEFAGQRGLTGALQAGQHDHGGRNLGEPQPPGLAAEGADQLLVDDLDDLLRRVQRARDFLAAGPLLDPGDERPDDRERDVGFQQRDTDLARGRIDVGG